MRGRRNSDVFCGRRANRQHNRPPRMEEVEGIPVLREALRCA